MQLPPLLAAQFQYLAKANTDEELFGILLEQPPQMLEFFENVTEFDSWCEKHPDLMKGILGWAMEQAYQDNLSFEFAKRYAQVIYDHTATLDPFVPLNITVEIEGKKLEMNGLLLATSSHFFRQRLIKECRDAGLHTLKLEGVTYDLFLFIEEFINTGSSWKLWRKTKEELLKTLLQASQWEIFGLVDAIQESMKRYLDSGNALDLLLLSHEKDWFILKRACIDFINGEYLGVRIIDKGKQALGLEFLDFKERGMGIFESLKPYITHLIISSLLTQEVLFRDVVNGCPQLISIDIAHTHAFSENLRYIPSHLQELNISKCGWINQNTLREIIQTCPRLKSLDISSNPQLTYNAWSEIQKLRDLKALDFSRCHQLTNEEFKLLLKACRKVTDLSTEDCGGVYENAFFDIGRMVPELLSLNVARCTINDSSLIEIATQCKSLTRLDLSRCANITKKGVLETVKEALQLKELNLTRTQIPDFVIEEIHQMSPFLKIEQ